MQLELQPIQLNVLLALDQERERERRVGSASARCPCKLMNVDFADRLSVVSITRLVAASAMAKCI